MSSSFHLPGQSLSYLLTQMKGEWALQPLLENGNIFALICIITDDLHPSTLLQLPPCCPPAWNMENPAQNQKLATLVLGTLNMPNICPSPTQNSLFVSVRYPAFSPLINFCLFCFLEKVCSSQSRIVQIHRHPYIFSPVRGEGALCLKAYLRALKVFPSYLQIQSTDGVGGRVVWGQMGRGC